MPFFSFQQRVTGQNSAAPAKIIKERKKLHFNDRQSVDFPF
jgi:hypothetical protein